VLLSYTPAASWLSQYQQSRLIDTYNDSLRREGQTTGNETGRAEAGEALAPVPAALTRFYDAIEARVRALGGDLRTLRTERQMMQILGSLGMMPASVTPYIEAFDDAEIDMCAQQIIGFSRLTRLRGEEGVAAARALAERTAELADCHKELALTVLDDLPGGAMGRAMWRLTHVLSVAGYPHPAQRAFRTAKDTYPSHSNLLHCIGIHRLGDLAHMSASTSVVEDCSR